MYIWAPSLALVTCVRGRVSDTCATPEGLRGSAAFVGGVCPTLNRGLGEPLAEGVTQ